MDTAGFRAHLESRENPPEAIDGFIAAARRFESFLMGRRFDRPGDTARDHVAAFARDLIDRGENTWDRILAIVRYGRFVGDDDIFLAAVELLDGSEALETLYARLRTELGHEGRDAVFAGEPPPPLGTPPAARTAITASIIDRLEQIAGSDGAKDILADGLRQRDPEVFQEDRERYLDAPDFDTFLAQKGDAFIEMLESLSESGEPFFTQPITPEVVEFIRDRPEISHGERVGSTLYEVKIPYQTADYLEAPEEDRRYLYCHCPWVREALKEGSDIAVSPIFCQCSAGFHKAYWETVLGEGLHAEVVESVLAGDDRCRIAIQLPAEVVGPA